MMALFMTANVYGWWELICHVADHQAKGMVANYWVHKQPCPLRPLRPTKIPQGGGSSHH